MITLSDIANLLDAEVESNLIKNKIGTFLEEGGNIEETIMKNQQYFFTGNGGTRTLLQLAAEKGNLAIVNNLLDRGARIDNESSPRGLTALHFAAGNGHKEIVELLLNRGAAIDAKSSSRGLTPLHSAAVNGQKEIVELLLNRGAAIDAKCSSRGLTPLEYAVKGKKASTAFLLRQEEVRQKSSQESHSKERLEIDARFGGGETAFYWAVKDGNMQEAQFFLDKGADINVRKCGKFSAEFNGETPLGCAIKNKNKEMIDFLLDKGADINARGEEDKTALHFAAEEGLAKTVLTLLDKGADINSVGDGYDTPLLCAAKNNHTSVIKLLLDKGAKIDRKDFLGTDVFYWAAVNHNSEIINLLLDKGADINTKNNYGETPLYIVMKSKRSGYEEIAKLLLDKGVDINAGGDKDNQTPLSIALEIGGKVAEIFKAKSRENKIDALSTQSTTPLPAPSQTPQTEPSPQAARPLSPPRNSTKQDSDISSGRT